MMIVMVMTSMMMTLLMRMTEAAMQSEMETLLQAEIENVAEFLLLFVDFPITM